MNNSTKQVLTNLNIFTSKINHTFSTKHELHNAGFARFDQLKPLFHSITDFHEQLLLGQTGYHQLLSVTKTPKRPELGNMLVFGRTGGGKGLLAIPQLLTYPESVIVNDLKGELRRHTSGYRSTFSDVFVIDPRGTGHRFDPIAGKLDESALLEVAFDLLQTPGETDGAIFSNRAANMLMILFLAAQAEGCPKFPYVREALLAGVSATAERLQKVNPRLARRFLYDPIEKVRRTRFEDKFLLHAFATINAKLTPILTETVVKTLSGSDFTAKDIISGGRPVTVYIQWPEGQLKSLAPLVRLIMGTIIKGMITTHDEQEGKGCRPVLVLADEAGRTKIPTLADDAATVRSRGIVLWISVQDIRQLELVYGKALAHTLINNTDTTIFYRPNDKSTAEYMEQLLGRKSGFASSHQERKGDSTSEGKSEQAVPLMTVQEIMQMEDEEIIIRHRNLPPIRAYRIDWRDFPELAARRSLEPTVVKPIAGLPPISVFLDEDYGENAFAEEEPQAFEPVSPESFSAWQTPRTGTIYTGETDKQGKPRRVD
jgi:type IV secretion system protein VirD4